LLDPGSQQRNDLADAATLVERLDHTASTHAIDGAVDEVFRLGAPHLVGVEWHRHENAVAVVTNERHREPLYFRHRPIIAPS
jgi:hypothetical protein